MKVKKVLKYVLSFIIHYVTSTAILWLLNEDKTIGILLIDGLIITCLFEFVELISSLIQKHTRKKCDDKKEQSERTDNNDETIVTWISGICFILLIIFRILI